MASLSTEANEHVRPRALFRVTLIALGLIAIFLPHILVRLVLRRSIFAQLFLKWSGWCVGARVTVAGAPITGKVLYLANHVSWLDIMVLAGESGCAFIAKADMESWPVLGWLAKQNNSVFVARDNRNGVHQQKEDVQKALLSGQPLCLFPEGTTAAGRDLLPFRSSLLAAVTPAPDDIQIQPVAIDYGDLTEAVAWVTEESVGKVALKIMGRYPRIPVKLTFLPPLDHADFADRKAIAAHSREEIAKELGQVGLREERLF